MQCGVGYGRVVETQRGDTVMSLKIARFKYSVVREIEAKSVRTPQDIVDIFVAWTKRDAEFDPDQETLLVFNMNAKHKLKSIHPVSRGNVCGTVFDIKSILRSAVISAASGVVVLHNHPSGDVQPSFEDICATRQLVNAGPILGIQIMDHLIVGTEHEGDDRFFSFRESGVVDFNSSQKLESQAFA